MRVPQKLLIVATLLMSGSVCIGAQIDEPLDGRFKFVSGKERLISFHQHRLPVGASIVDSLKADDGVYLLVKANEEAMVWKIDRRGENPWKKSIGVDDQRASASLFWSQKKNAIGVCKPLSDHGMTRLTFFDAEGNNVSKLNVKLTCCPKGAIELNGSNLLFFGYGDATFSGGATLTNPEGKTIWSESYRTEDQTVTAKTIGLCSLSRATLMPDSSVILAGQTGVYGKFGMGKSKLWLLKIGPDGKKVAERFVDDAYFDRRYHFEVDASVNGPSIRYWQHRLNDNGTGMNLWPYIIQLSQDLKENQTYNLTESMPPSSVVLDSLSPAILPILTPGFSDDPLTVRLSGIGGERESQFVIRKRKDVDTGILPLVAFRDESEVMCLAVDNWMGRDFLANLLVIRLKNRK